MDATSPGGRPRTIGRYRLYAEIASGGIATVHLGRLVGPAGFSKSVAIKRLHPTYARDPEFVTMFLDEARLTARIQHNNVVSTLDVVATEGELFVVMEYVEGDSLAKLVGSPRRPVPPRFAVGIMAATLYGLHAAHEARNEQGEPLSIVHRDVSPQNILVGRDGVTRVADFGIAKAVGRLHTTREGHVKGKFSYMSPEQLRLRPVDRRTDVYAASVVLWEILAGRRLFVADDPGSVAMQVLRGARQPPSAFASNVPSSLDALVMQGLARRPANRFVDARHMAVALEGAVASASLREIGEWVEWNAGPALTLRETLVAKMESDPLATDPVGILVSNPPDVDSVQSASRAGEPHGVTAADTRLSASMPGVGALRTRLAWILAGVVGLTATLYLSVSWWPRARPQASASEAIASGVTAPIASSSGPPTPANSASSAKPVLDPPAAPGSASTPGSVPRSPRPIPRRPPHAPGAPSEAASPLDFNSIQRK